MPSPSLPPPTTDHFRQLIHSRNQNQPSEFPFCWNINFIWCIRMRGKHWKILTITIEIPPNIRFVNINLILNSWIVSMDIEFITIDIFFFSLGHDDIKKKNVWILERMSYPFTILLQPKFSILRIARKIFTKFASFWCIFSGYFSALLVQNQMRGLHHMTCKRWNCISCTSHNSIWAQSWATEFGEILQFEYFNNSEWNFRRKFKLTFNIISKLRNIEASLCCGNQNNTFSKPKCYDFCVVIGESRKLYFLNDRKSIWTFFFCIVSSLAGVMIWI